MVLVNFTGPKLFKSCIIFFNLLLSSFSEPVPTGLGCSLVVEWLHEFTIFFHSDA